MKKFTVTMLAALVLVFCTMGIASAVNFTISEVGFDNLNGATEKFKWSVSARPDFSFSLLAGETKTFTYGWFNTTDFPLNNTDLNDNNDRFRAFFDVTPPASGQRARRVGSPDAVSPSNANRPDYVDVDFNNNKMTRLFGDGGLYQVWFLDTSKLRQDGSKALKASIELVSAPVPEPGTLLLLGSGLAGLALYRRKKAAK